ncbi:MAG: hypothetical protein JWR87_4017 [Segetibacter sp.]|jgi:hypothetical protein|nr:hypothetical protein [Segetibacter sp.]
MIAIGTGVCFLLRHRCVAIRLSVYLLASSVCNLNSASCSCARLKGVATAIYANHSNQVSFAKIE